VSEICLSRARDVRPRGRLPSLAPSRKNQMNSSCLEHAFMIWFGPRTPIWARSFIAAPSEVGQMAAPDYVPIFFKSLHLAGRPRMSSRPSSD
jgi:hypothetical protein